MNDLEKVDVFSNLPKVSNINCPVFLIHGIQDEVIPHTQSVELMNKIKYVFEWFPNRGNHSNITVKYRSKFYAKVKLFLEHLVYFKKQQNKSDLDITDESNLDTTKITINGFRNRTKIIKCEENYIQSERKNDKSNFSPIRSIILFIKNT
jgi:hypothetical protein